MSVKTRVRVTSETVVGGSSGSSPSGHVAGNCRTGQTLKKPKYLSVCDREERGRGGGVLCMCE